MLYFPNLAGYCILIPRVELFSYVRNELLLDGFVVVAVVICAIARCRWAVYIVEMAEVEKNINDTDKITRHGDKQLTNLTLPSFVYHCLSFLPFSSGYKQQSIIPYPCMDILFNKGT